MPAPFGHGLVLGKFYPPHLGHLHLTTLHLPFLRPGPVMTGDDPGQVRAGLDKNLSFIVTIVYRWYRLPICAEPVAVRLPPRETPG
jgi:hypothetical protein